MKNENLKVVLCFIAFFLVAIGILMYAFHLNNKKSEEIYQAYQASEYVTQKPFIAAASLEAKAKNDVLATTNIKSGELDVKIGYIKLYLTQPLVSEDVTEKLIYYSAYLKELAITYESLSQNKVIILGQKTLEYVKDVYTKKQTKDDQISVTRINDIKNLLLEVEKDSNHAITNMIDIINKKV